MAVAQDEGTSGEVVYDSILLKKQETKRYWEQLMMAARRDGDRDRDRLGGDRLALADRLGDDAEPHALLHTQQPEWHLRKVSLDGSHQHTWLSLARPPNSPQIPVDSSPGPLRFEDSGVDSSLTVSPKIVDSVAKKGESVVERDIRLQRMREQQVALEREAAAAAAAAAAAMTSITTAAAPSPPSPPPTDDGFVSIPTTDEGNFSEYGSEEKELLSLDGNASSRVTSPEVGPEVGLGEGETPTGTALPVRQHQRTQSLDSTSSGHSSGSGSGSGGSRSGAGSRSGITITREIAISAGDKDEAPAPVQHNGDAEVDEDHRDEKTLTISNHVQQMQRQFSSPDYTNSTPPLKRASSTSQLLDDPPKAQYSSNTISRKNGVLSGMVAQPVTPVGDARRFTPNPGQKGLMQRFLASRGKMSSGGMLTSPPSSPTSPTIIPLSPAAISKLAAVMDTPTAPIDRTDGAPVRRGYVSAEDKIQEELKEMRRREEELRMQRARTLARSQPNLLNIMDECNGTGTINGGTTSSLSSNQVVVDKLPNMATLRSALSNPNLLDDNNGDSNEKPLQRNGGLRKRNALIEQWENRIQQQN